MNPLTIVVILVIAAVIFLLLILRFVGNLYQKVGPNEALIIYGRRTRVITNGGSMIFPLLEQATRFSLELMSFDVAPEKSLYTNQAIAVNVEAVTQLKVRSDRENILTAAEQFLSKSPEDREGLIRLVMEGHLRGIVGQLTVEQIVKEPEMVSEKMRSTSSSDLTKMGLEIVSFTIKEVRDSNEYISNMGRPELERTRRDANVAAALATRDTQIQQAAAMQAATEARTAAETKQAEFERDRDLKKAAYEAEVKKQKATADKAYDIQSNVMQQQVVAESTRVQEIEKTAQVKVEEAEIKRRELELQATMLKQAEADRQRITMQAEAERRRLALEAEGRAEALKAQGAAEAEATRLKGLAEADVIRARGEAEAEAMRVKADAYHQYNQAAVLNSLLTSLPEIVRALAEPLAKIDRVTIVSTGDGANGHTSLGANRLTGDMVNILAQVPALVETLSGVKMEDLLSRVPGLHPGENGAEPSGTVTSDNTSEDHK